MDPDAAAAREAVSLAAVQQLRDALVATWPLPVGVESGSGGGGRALSTDAALCRLGVELGARISEVRANAMAARLQLDSLYEASTHAAALVSTIDRIEAEKIAALETEQVAVDSVLEELQDAIAASTTAALDSIASDGDALGKLRGRLTAISDRLQALPRVPVEPGSIAMSTAGTDPDAVASARVIAPRALLAGDLVLGAFPRVTRMGVPLRISIRIVAQSALYLDPEEAAAVALGAAATYIYIAARIIGIDPALHTPPPSLRISVAPNAGSRQLELVLGLPHEIPVNSVISIEGIFVAGVALPGLPARIPLCKGLTPGLLLREGTHNLQTPCVTARGLVVIPRDGSSAVRFFDSAVSLAAGCQGLHLARFSRACHLPAPHREVSSTASTLHP